MRFRTAMAAGVVAAVGISATSTVSAHGAPLSRQAVTSAVLGALPPGQVLAWSTRGDGTVIESFGRPVRSADDIVVYVPGASATLTTALGAPGHAANHPRRVARALLEQMAAVQPGANASLVYWLGYNAPETGNLSSATSSRAKAGAPALRRFVNGLPEGAHVTLVCHSYGSVVCGRALPGMRPVDVVVAASPGMDVESARELPAAAQIWVLRTPDDPIGLAPNVRVLGLGHGGNPAAEGFGATRLAVGSARGHSEYLKPGTTSLDGIARVALGLGSTAQKETQS